MRWLHCSDASHNIDKVYFVQLISANQGFAVRTFWGRRGGTLQWHISPYEGESVSTREFETIVGQKIQRGYMEMEPDIKEQCAKSYAGPLFNFQSVSLGCEFHKADGTVFSINGGWSKEVNENTAIGSTAGILNTSNNTTNATVSSSPNVSKPKVNHVTSWAELLAKSGGEL